MLRVHSSGDMFVYVYYWSIWR